MAVIGVSTCLWTTQWGADARGILANIRRLGFDAVQIPLLAPGAFDPEEMWRILTDLDLRCYLSAGLKADNNVISPDPEARRRGVAFLKQCVRFAAELGAPFLSGSFHAAFGVRADGPVDAQQWQRSAQCLREVAREARNHRLDIVLEPINRYESCLVNTAAQARTLIEMIGESNVKIQLDTFHMNIEEPDFYNTIRSVGEDLVHFHVAENHRGRFNTGMIPWDQVFKALADTGYKGAIVIESFVPEVREVATAACIWRKMAASADALAEEGLKFIRKLAMEYGL